MTLAEFEGAIFHPGDKVVWLRWECALCGRSGIINGTNDPDVVIAAVAETHALMSPDCDSLYVNTEGRMQTPKV